MANGKVSLSSRLNVRYERKADARSYPTLDEEFAYEAADSFTEGMSRLLPEHFDKRVHCRIASDAGPGNSGCDDLNIVVKRQGNDVCRR